MPKNAKGPPINVTYIYIRILPNYYLSRELSRVDADDDENLNKKIDIERPVDNLMAANDERPGKCLIQTGSPTKYYNWITNLYR